MPPIKCIVKSSKKPGNPECTYDFGTNLDEMVKIFGAPVVFSNAMQKIKPRLLDYGRNLLEAGKPIPEINKLMAEWKPGISAPRAPKDPKEAARQAFEKLTPEERKVLIASLK